MRRLLWWFFASPCKDITQRGGWSLPSFFLKPLLSHGIFLNLQFPQRGGLVANPDVRIHLRECWNDRWSVMEPRYSFIIIIYHLQNYWLVSSPLKIAYICHICIIAKVKKNIIATSPSSVSKLYKNIVHFGKKKNLKTPSTNPSQTTKIIQPNLRPFFWFPVYSKISKNHQQLHLR